MGRRYTTFLAASDLHGNLQDKATVKQVLKFKEEFNPEITIFMGDLFDLQALMSRATDDDKAVPILEDVEAGLDFMREFKPDVYLKGNHEVRLDKLSQSRDAVKSSLAQKLMQEMDEEFAAMGTRTLPYCKRNGVYRLGKLSFVHGYSCGIGATRKHAFTYGNVLMGHIHAIDAVSIESHSQVMGRAIGCLCQLDIPYNAAHIGALRQAHGFAYGVVDNSTGEFFCAQAQEINGKWFCPSDFNL